MVKRFKEDVTRQSTFIGLRAWHEGESKELEKWIGFGFFNHIFLFKNGMLTLFYDVEEGDKFHEVLKEKLKEDFFDRLCEHFFEFVKKGKTANSNSEIYEILVRLWPAFTIFDELSKYPEIGNGYMIRRLIRLREHTESFSYELENRINEEEQKNCIFFQGKIFETSLEQFINEKGFEVVK
ncbi:hypothetical protein HY449_00080 [Candidatus Pacearchaeota archaeon]|nr:hypothetical protein [Candidatus Pacearchaeota archaeon]